MADIKTETLALAALSQACLQIRSCAVLGRVNPEDCAVLLRGLIITNPKSAEDIYDPKRLIAGFRQLIASMGAAPMSKSGETIELTKLALKLMTLAETIEKNTEIFNKLGNDIDSLRNQVLDLHPDYETAGADTVMDPNCVRLYSDLYSAIISPNFPKLIIHGERAYLSLPENQQIIRSLLLAAIRAIVLWRQVGGRRLFFIFRRKAIVECARQGAQSL